MRRLLCSALLSLAATVAPGPVASQSTSAERLATARAQVRAMQLDSAALLLRETVGTIGRPSREERVEAWLLLGVVQFYKGDDSGTAADFRHALALEPRLEASGLARYDSALVILFEAQRRPYNTCRTLPGRPRASIRCRRGEESWFSVTWSRRGAALHQAPL